MCLGKPEESEGSRAGLARPAGSSWFAVGGGKAVPLKGSKHAGATWGTPQEAQGELPRQAVSRLCAPVSPALAELSLPSLAGAALRVLLFPTLTRSCLFPGD